MSRAIEYLKALPPRYQAAALVTIARARESRMDKWPTIDLIAAIAEEFGVEVPPLAAMLGFLQMPLGEKPRIYFDAMRRGNPPLGYAYDRKLQRYYDFFRYAMAKDGERPFLARPLYRI